MLLLHWVREVDSPLSFSLLFWETLSDAQNSRIVVNRLVPRICLDIGAPGKSKWMRIGRAGVRRTPDRLACKNTVSSPKLESEKDDDGRGW
jgi:hypothetical protein